MAVVVAARYGRVVPKYKSDIRLACEAMRRGGTSEQFDLKSKIPIRVQHDPGIIQPFLSLLQGKIRRFLPGCLKPEHLWYADRDIWQWGCFTSDWG